MDKITKAFKSHYEGCFDQHGATARGVDWRDAETANMRYEKMLNVIQCPTSAVSLLDVGCGYGGLLEYSHSKKLPIKYTGIDVAENMLEHARKKFPESTFLAEDIFDMDANASFDYVVCNGILTQKLSSPPAQMKLYMEKLIEKMFQTCSIGIAFNVMTDRVNFQVDNLFYQNPEALLTHCLNNVTRRIRIDHSYPMYEYTVYLFKEGG